MEKHIFLTNTCEECAASAAQTTPSLDDGKHPQQQKLPWHDFAQVM